MNRRYISIVLGAAAPLVAGPALAGAGPSASGEAGVTDLIRTFWPIIVMIVTVFSGGVLLGLGTRFASVTAFNALKTRVEVIEAGRSATTGSPRSKTPP